MHSLDLQYALLMLTALAACAFLLRRHQARLPLRSREKLGIGCGAFCGAMIGAKLPFLFGDWEALRSGAAWFADGKTIMLGIVGGYFGVEIAKWLLEVRIKTGDTFAVPVAVAVAIGRLACFRAGCCYGKPTHLPWGVTFPDALGAPGLARHPTQLYESAFHLLMALGLGWMLHRGLLRGQLIKLYILAYLAFRFVTEFLRPEPQVAWGLTGYQLAALVLAPLFLWLWARDHRRFASQLTADSTAGAQGL